MGNYTFKLCLFLGSSIEPNSCQFIWLGNICDPALKLPSASIAPVIHFPLATDFEPLCKLTSVLRRVLGNNFIPGIGMLGGMLLGLGYQKIIQNYGYCPVVIATGGLSCGKTTTLKALLCLLGSVRTGSYMHNNEI